MTVVTRFAPSPTGFLHIGSARTALFNYLFARNRGGKFLLRIEDTDRKRSTKEAMDAILEGMKWLELDFDGEEVHQFARQDKHKKAVDKLLSEGKAYKCYCTQEELEEMRSKAQAEKKSFKYDGRWRNRDESEAPEGVDPVIRLKAPKEGEIVIKDAVQGEVKVSCDTLDDMVLLRSDGTPTYMLAVVVDDHYMGITHVIRGDDHFTNTFRQIILYDALGYPHPDFAHIPLIHGSDGAKMSKRHGALGVDAYRDMGYLPEAMRNYLLRLGWSHGDDEIISTEQAIKWFDLEHIGKSPAKFDFTKLDSVNGHYIKEANNQRLFDLILPMLEEKKAKPLSDVEKNRVLKMMEALKQRVKTLVELSDNALFLVLDGIGGYTDKAAKALDDEGKKILGLVLLQLEKIEDFSHDKLYQVIDEWAKSSDLKLGKVMAPIRAAITGSHASPSMFEVMEVLGKEETLKRLKSV